jgi:hypothetical protein
MVKVTGLEVRLVKTTALFSAEKSVRGRTPLEVKSTC